MMSRVGLDVLMKGRVYGLVIHRTAKKVGKHLQGLSGGVGQLEVLIIIARKKINQF